MFTIPMTLVVVTVFAIYLSAVQSILAATTMTVLSTALVTALVSLVHLYATVAVGAGVVLILAVLAGWYARTDPGTVYAAKDRDTIARFHLRHRGR